MKKLFRIVVLMIVFVFLVIDFVGLWKYKLSGNKYVLASSEDSDVGGEELPIEDETEYIELTSKSLASDEVLFIKSIDEENEEYVVKGIIYTPYEVKKEDYTALREGKSVEILGNTYTKKEIKSNNLILKSSDTNAKGYYINYDTKNKKYVLKESKNDFVVYKSTEKDAKVTAKKGTAYSIIKNGKTENKKIEDVIESHKNNDAPEGETGSINTCVFTFDKNDVCTKIVETCR